MDQVEIEKIENNLFAIVTHTVCGGSFLLHFSEKNILGSGDIDALVAYTEESKRALEFYQKIQTRPDSYPVLILALQQTQQHGIVKILETGIIPHGLSDSGRSRQRIREGLGNHKSIRLDPVPQAGIQFQVSDPARLFTGRRNELKRLHDTVQSIEAGSGRPTVISQMTFISGLGGIGKTQLTRKYIMEYGKDYDYNCIWLHAETEHGLSESFKSLATNELGIPTKDANEVEKKIGKIVEDVYRYFQVSKCLFVFDNAEDEPWLQKFLPVRSPTPNILRPHIILTSRNRNWGNGIQVMDLAVLTKEDAVNLVKRGVSLENDRSPDEAIHRLVDRLQYLPLTIQQAISYIHEQQQSDDYSVDAYVEEFEKKKQILLDYQETSGLWKNYDMTTFATWEISIKKILKDQTYGEVAQKILSTLAYLIPDNIKREILLLMKDIISKSHLIEGVKLLIKYSIINGEDKMRVLNVHRLVQEVTRVNLHTKGEAESTIEGAIEMLCQQVGVLPQENLDHMLAVWPHIFKYPSLIKKYSKLAQWTVYQLSEKGRDEEAIRFSETAEKKLAPCIGDFHDDILGCLHYKSSILRRQARFQESFELISKVLNNMKRLGLEDKDRALNFMTNLGHLYFDTGKYQDSANTFQVIWDKRAVRFPEDHGRFLCTRKNYARAIKQLGRSEEALKIAMAVYSTIRRLGVPNKAMFLSVLSILGECLNNLGRFDEALEILQENYEDIEQFSGSGKTEMAIVLNVIGNALRSKGDFEGALGKHSQVEKEYLRAFGKDHHTTLIGRTEKAHDFLLMGRFQEAIIILEETLSKLETLPAKDLIRTICVEVWLATALMKEGGNLPRASAIVEELKRKIVENGLENDPYIRNEICKQIDCIQNELRSKESTSLVSDMSLLVV